MRRAGMLVLAIVLALTLFTVDQHTASAQDGCQNSFAVQTYVDDNGNGFLDPGENVDVNRIVLLRLNFRPPRIWIERVDVGMDIFHPPPCGECYLFAQRGMRWALEKVGVGEVMGQSTIDLSLKFLPTLRDILHLFGS